MAPIDPNDRPRLDNEAYYDDFSNWYERERGHGYHQLIDDLETDLVRRYGEDKDVLEVGCGTGLILERVARFARAQGMDLSDGMLAKARERGLDVKKGSATELPYDDESFDVVYSFKVLAHVEDIHTAMSEMARVTRPGGYVLAEFYNPRSLRYLVKAIKRPTAVSSQTDDHAVYTRYDTVDDIRGYLSSELAMKTIRGIRIVTPVAAIHKVPILGRVVRFAEERLADLPGARELGGFVVAVCQKR